MKIRQDNFWQKMIKRREFVLILFIIAIGVALQVATEGKFLSVANLLAMADNKAPEALVTIGVTYLLITKDFDLSVSSVMAFTGVIFAVLLGFGIPFVAAMLLALIAGGSIGLLNGFLVTKLNMASFIATLGTLYIGRSLTQVISHGKPVANLPQDVIDMGNLKLAGFPWYFLLLVGVVIVLQLLLRKNKSMNQLFYIGTNETAAQMVGINTRKARWILFIVSALIAALAGVILTAKAHSASPIAFQNLELKIIAASVIGGASISGGQGSIVGAVLGYLVVVLIGNSMTMLGISPYWEGVIFGGVLAVAAIADAFAQSRRTR
jgi:ribose transport system permease protein